jgi:large subunit ribosomal protein L4
MKVSVYNKSGQETERKLEIKQEIFGIEPNDHAIYLDCKQFLANNRQGTHKTKERGEVKGSTKKIKRQKGTGTARAGDIKNPLFRGGGRVFGPEPRDYRFKLNKKVKRLARKSAVSYKFKNEAIYVVDNFDFEEIKTKNMTTFINNLELFNKKLLFVVAEQNNYLYLSSRNLKQVEVLNIRDLNTYEIVKASVLIFEEKTIDVFENYLA